MRWGLRYQLLVPPAVLLLGVAGTTAWTATASATRAREQLDGRMRKVIQALSKPPHFGISPRVLEQMSLLSEAQFVLIEEDGSSLKTLPAIPEGLPSPVTSSDDLQSLRLEAHVWVDGERYLCSGVRLRQGILYVLYPEALWRNALWEAVRPSLILGGVLGLASFALAVGVGQRLTRRIQELERRTRQIADGDFSPMRLPRRDDELRDLGRSVNEMAERLARLQEAVQRTERLRLLGQVSGGLAHHLRNGVTGARLAVQLHLREHEAWQQGNGPPPDPEALAVALRQLTLVENNLKRFLDLGSGKQVRPQPCSVRALVAEAVALLQPQCRHAGIELRWQPPAEELTLAGDAGQLQQLFFNVLGNAVEAAGPGGWVRVECGLEKSRSLIVVEVIDSGPGPPAELAMRLFEPFVTGKREGVGLGLAVARQVAEGHGGTITWSRIEGHTCFRIELSGLPTKEVRSANPDHLG
jgi:signal transduction histidine kinase